MTNFSSGAMSQSLLTGIIIISFVAFICQSLSFAMPGWIKYVEVDSNNTESFEGLWLKCPSGWSSCRNALENRTVSVHDAKDLTLWVTQSYGVLGILLAIIASFSGCCCCDESPAGVASSVFNFGAGFSIIIGVVTYGIIFEEVTRLRTDLVSAELDYCFWLSVVACTLALFAGLLGLCSTDRYYKYKE